MLIIGNATSCKWGLVKRLLLFLSVDKSRATSIKDKVTNNNKIYSGIV